MDGQTAMVIYLVIIIGGVLAALTLRNRHQRYRMEQERTHVQELIATQRELQARVDELNSRVVAIQRLLEDAA